MRNSTFLTPKTPWLRWTLTAVLAWFGILGASPDGELVVFGNEAAAQAGTARRVLSVGKLRALGRDGAGAVGDMAGDEVNVYKGKLNVEAGKLKDSGPERMKGILFGSGEDSVVYLRELIEDPAVRSPIEDRKNKKRFVELFQEWWLMPSEVEARLRAEAERLKRLRANMDSSKFFVPKRIPVPGGGFREVVTMGWHLAWRGNVYKGYPFDRMTYVSFYSYDVDPFTGGAQHPEYVAEFLKGDFIAHARAASVNADEKKGPKDSIPCNVLLSVSLHNELDLETFFENPVAQQALIDTIMMVMDSSKADGIEINFVHVPLARKEEFIKFMSSLGATLHKYPKRPLFLFMSVPANDPYRVYDLTRLNPFVDYFVLQGYNFHHTGNPDRPFEKKPSSIFNFTAVDPEYDIRTMVQRRIKELGRFNSGRLLLALSYTGVFWEGDGPDAFAGQEITYKDILYNYILDINGTFKKDTVNLKDSTGIYTVPELRYDASRSTMVWERRDVDFERLRRGGQPITYQLYFDDTMTLATKYRYALKEQLGGVAIWSLGDDDNLLAGIITDELWEFRKPDGKYDGKLREINRRSQEVSTIMLASLMYLLIFMIAGFVKSLFVVDVRQGLFDSGRFRTMYLSFFIFMLLVLGYYMELFQYHVGILMIGVVIGSFISWMVLKSLQKQQASQP